MKKQLPLLLLLFGYHWTNLMAQQYGQYTLYSLQNSTTTQLIDTNNAVYKSWTHANNARTGYSSYLMPGGVLWRATANPGNQLTGGGMTGKVQKVAWDGTVLWSFTYSGATYCLHHDICPLPNGNVLLISYDVHSAAEVSAAGASQNIAVWSDNIIEVKPTGATTGEIVWQWRAWDHLVQNVNPAKANYQTSIVQHPERLNINYSLKKDWIHMNGLDYNPITDQIAFSSHYLNEWYIIDHSTTMAEAATGSGGNSGKGGDLLYRFGNPAAYQAAGSQILKVTHDAHWIPEGVPNTGRLVGFNNQGVSTTQSSIDQVTPPKNGYNFDLTLGQAYAPTTYEQRHACNGYSSNMSNSQQLPNGNMLVCMATIGLIYETNPGGTTIWSRSTGGSVAHAFRYSECYVNNAAPPIPTISVAGNVLTSSNATTYQWYKNGVQIAGATAQTYTPTLPGIYLVRATNAVGCEGVYSYSLGHKVVATTPLSVSISSSLTTVCAGDSVQLNATSSGGSGSTTWLWSSAPAGFSSTLPNPWVTPLVETTYKVMATNNLEVDSGSIDIQVNPLPSTPQISQAGNDLTSTAGNLYQWYWNGVLQPGLSSQTISPSQNGNYQVQVIDLNGCKSDTSGNFNFILNSIRKPNQLRNVSVYPNPSTQRFTLWGNAINQSSFTIHVFDARGREVLTSNNQPVFDLIGFPSGIYHLRIDNVMGETAHFQLQLIP